MMHEMSLMVLKIEGLRGAITGSAEEQAGAKAVLESLRWSIDNLHTLALDSRDDYAESSRSVAGIERLIERFVDALVRATIIPRSRFLGEQPGGLNANGDTEMRAWFDSVASQQKKKLTRPINRVLEILFAIEKNQGRKAPEKWTIKYNPLWQLSAKEKAEAYFSSAQAFQIMEDMGWVASDEVRQQLVADGAFAPIEGL
jgi:phage-related protein (TIGR01555 family)